MRLYDLLRQVSAVLTPNTNSFYDFMLSSCDFNLSFLRTRVCLESIILNIPDNVSEFTTATKRNAVLADIEILDLEKMNRVLVCFREKFAEGDQYYEKRVVFRQTVTDVLVDCELYLDCYDDEDIGIRALSAYDDGYRYAYVLDLTTTTYSINTFPVVSHQNLVILDLGSDDDLFYGGWYYDNSGVEYDLKATKNRGTFVDSILIVIDNPEIDAFQSFLCRYRVGGDGRVEFYPNKHDLLVRDNCSLLIVNESAAELTVSITGTDYILPENGQKYIETVDWGREKKTLDEF